MAKTSVLSRPLPSMSQPRNTFDRSFFKRLNWSAGMLLPVFCQFVPAGSSGRINRSIFMRTNAVNTAAFPKMDTHIDFYKVPLKLLMTRYEEFKTNISDVNSTSFTTVGDESPDPPASMPFFDMQTVSGYFASTLTDDCGFQVVSGSKRLWDLLDYNDDYIYRAVGDPDFRMSLNSLRLQAYQKVYYDHYRNTAYEINRSIAYNADRMYTQGVGTGEWQLNDVIDLFRMHYVNYRKDFFMNIYPALNYVVSQPTGLNWSIPGSVVGTGLNPGVGSASNSLLGNSTGIISQTNVYNNIGISVQTIRAAFALDKLMRLSSYAPKHVKDQMEARFGLKQHASSGYESQYLGSFKNDIVIGEVTSTADTSSSGGAELGTIGGRGVGAQQMGHDINFEVTADDNDSIIIGVMYTLCRSSYDSFRIDAFNFKFTREDIFNPEFMDLGLRPVTLKEMYTPSGSSYTLAQLNTILGYVPRDQEYKLGIDENHGLFRNGEQLGSFVNHSNVNMTQRGHVLGTSGVNRSFFKISPSDLDAIFVQAFDESDQKTDQFFGELTFKFVVRQNMSVHGQPRL